MKKYSLILLLFIISFVVIYSNYRVFNSYKQQIFLLNAINTNNYSTIPDEILEDIEYQYPNLSVTSMPLASIKGRALLDKPARVGEALDLLREGRKVKTNLFMTESLMTDIFFANKQLDSAFYYSRIAYEGLPLNTKHFVLYLKSLAAKKEKDEMRSTYNNIKGRIGDNKKEELAKFYFAGMLQFRDSVLIEEAKEWKKKELNNLINDNSLKILISYVIYGDDNVKKADSINNEGRKLFESKKFVEATRLFSKAIDIIPSNIKFYENKISSLFEQGLYPEVYSFYLNMPEDVKENNGYIEYLVSVSLFKQNEKKLACELFNLSILLGYPISQGDYNPCN